MPGNRYPRRMLYGQLSEGRRLAHGPKRRFKDQLKKALQNFNLNPINFEGDATNRAGWRASCSEGAKHFEAARASIRETRRQKRHEARSAEPFENNQQFQCPECGRLCRSRMGLISHRRTHERTRAGSSGSHVIIDTDGLP